MNDNSALDVASNEGRLKHILEDLFYNKIDLERHMNEIAERIASDIRRQERFDRIPVGKISRWNYVTDFIYPEKWKKMSESKKLYMMHTMRNAVAPIDRITEVTTSFFTGTIKNIMDTKVRDSCFLFKVTDDDYHKERRPIMSTFFYADCEAHVRDFYDVFDVLSEYRCHTIIAWSAKLYKRMNSKFFKEYDSEFYERYATLIERRR